MISLAVRARKSIIASVQSLHNIFEVLAHGHVVMKTHYRLISPLKAPGRCDSQVCMMF